MRARSTGIRHFGAGRFGGVTGFFVSMKKKIPKKL